VGAFPLERLEALRAMMVSEQYAPELPDPDHRLWKL